MAVIIIDFPAQINKRGVCCIVINTVSTNRIFANVKRNVLVQRICFFCVKAHTVRRFNAVNLTCFIYQTAFVAKSENMLVIFSGNIMIRPVAEFAFKIIGKRCSVCEQKLRLFTVRQNKIIQIKVNGNAAIKNKFLFIFKFFNNRRNTVKSVHG